MTMLHLSDELIFNFLIRERQRVWRTQRSFFTLTPQKETECSFAIGTLIKRNVNKAICK